MIIYIAYWKNKNAQIFNKLCKCYQSNNRKMSNSINYIILFKFNFILF